tara:strand:- start:545 stop:805 length:261 start_codon:yes stop_codon:yes gene_type:complete
MQVKDLLQLEQDIDEWAATRSLCKSSKPDHAIGASALSSCKAQGYRARQTGKSQKMGGKKGNRVNLGGKKLKSKDYGGPVSPTKAG